MASMHELPDGARLAYDDLGAGRPVVLIHGVSMSRRFFDRNAAPLAERFRVINVDLRGHGESPAHEGGHTAGTARPGSPATSWCRRGLRI